MSKSTAHGEPAFPWKLHMMLEESSSGRFDHVISWETGNAFKVHDPIQFKNTVMKRFFNHTQYKSFQRLVNIYGFNRIKTGGRATGAYTHPFFIRGNPDACRFMIRISTRKNLKRKTNGRLIKNNQPMNKVLKFNEIVPPCASSCNGLLSFNDAPLIRCNNDIIEPTPINYGTINVLDTTGGVHPNLVFSDTVPCSDENTHNGYPSGQLLNTCNDNYVELDLDTIFDDDVHVFQKNRSKNNNEGYGYTINCIRSTK